MTEDYSKFRIKEYGLWDLYLHKNQFPFLGRCYAAAKREDADQVSSMMFSETEEFFGYVLPEWENGVRNFIGDFRTNLCFLGNTWNHLHGHLIPRFTNSIERY